jgi:hypothetical protein
MTDKEGRIYEQHCQEFRSLNGFFWQVPLIMMTLNGGLWYSVASLDLSVTAQRGVLAFAVIANLVMAAALGRLRNVMASLLVEIHAFQGTAAPGRARLIQYLFQSLMLFAALGAFLAALNPRQQFIRNVDPTTVQTRSTQTPIDSSATHRGAP